MQNEFVQVKNHNWIHSILIMNSQITFQVVLITHFNCNRCPCTLEMMAGIIKASTKYSVLDEICVDT